MNVSENSPDLILHHVRTQLGGLEIGRLLHRAWLFKDHTVVFDFVIRGYEIAIDVNITKNATVVVFGRRARANAFLAMAGFKRLPNGRFLFSSIKVDQGNTDAAAIILGHVLKIVDRISTMDRVPSDAKISDIIRTETKIVVVDVGANALSEPPYTFLRHAGHCRIVGFEPQKNAFDFLIANKSNDEDYFNYAVGRNGNVNINVYSGSGFTSSYRIDESTIDLFPKWRSGTRLQQILSIASTALDDVPDMPDFDLLKIDIQGGELTVFQNAERLLRTALSVITEVSFFPLYHDAPSFADVHNELVKQGFVLHKFLHQVYAPVSNDHTDHLPNLAITNQVVDGDAVYIKDFRDMNRFDVESLKKLALMSHYVFDSKDLTIRMLAELASRNEISKDAVGGYIASLQ